MENLANKYTHINGWGVDANPENDPTYPMKKRTNEEHEGYNWERPPQQPVNVEILKSNERPNVSAVFGTSTPPAGLSGAIRRFAFKYSESSYGRWVPLVLADRVNALEGLWDDLKKGIIPNIFAERGWKAEWKHNPKGLATRVVVGAAVTAAVIVMLSRKNKSWRKA